MLFDPARGQAYHACSAARANALSARATRHLRSGQPWLVDLGDTGKGADVLPVLLGKALQRGNPLAGFTPFRGHEFDRLRQGLVALRAFLQPLVDRHGFSVARRQLATARHWGTGVHWEGWGGMWDLNPRLPEPQSGALPTELIPPQGTPPCYHRGVPCGGISSVG